MPEQKTYLGSIVVFYKTIDRDTSYLVVQNTDTWNISFVSGAKEEKDISLQDTAKREVWEELRIDPSLYVLKETAIKHEFVFGPNKKERAWCSWSYTVFIADGIWLWTIHPSKELKSAVWMTAEQVLDALSFDDLKQVFRMLSSYVI